MSTFYVSGLVLNINNINALNYCKNPIRQVLISLHILQMRKLRLREVRNLLKITQLVSGGVRIESLDSQSPNVLPFLIREK